MQQSPSSSPGGPPEVAQRIYEFRLTRPQLQAAVDEQLQAIGRSVRLPGFRPGKIPQDVLRARYLDRATAAALEHFAHDCSRNRLPAYNILSTLAWQPTEEEGGMLLRVAATDLSDLPEFDASQVWIVRPTANRSDLEVAGLDPDAPIDHMRQQMLDRMDERYWFPIHPNLVEAEFQKIWAEALTQGATTGLEDEFRTIAERRVRLGAVVAEMARRNDIREQPIERKVIDLFLARAQTVEQRFGIEELRALE